MWKVDCGLRVVLVGVCVLQEESTSGKQKKDNEATWKQQVCSFFLRLTFILMDFVMC